MTKLQMTMKDGTDEDEESGNDYLAMHVYANSGTKGAKTLTAHNALVRNKYRSQQTNMLYLRLSAQEYFNQNKVLNLVLDAIDRTKDLFYNIRVFSSFPFETGRCANKFKNSYKLKQAECIGGGNPSSTQFYKNPQFLIYVDQLKLVNKAHAKSTFEILCTFQTAEAKTYVKLFLCHSTRGDSKLSFINDTTLVD